MCKTIYFYYLNNNNTITRLNNTTNEISILPLKEKTNFYFELMKDYEKTNEDLHRYKEDFFRCNELIKQVDKKFDYTQYYSNHGAVECVFRWYAKIELSQYNFNDVTYDEFYFIEKTYLAGIIYFDKKYKDIELQCYGYDFKAFYPQFLNKLKLQMFKEAGKKVKINELVYDKKGKLHYGIYKAKVICENPDFCKVFCFSKDGYYTHFDLEFIYEHKDKFKVFVTLDTEVAYNAILYYDAKPVSGEPSGIPCQKIFKNWYKKMSELKEKCPKNMLAKHLQSSLWGSLVKMKKSYYTEDEFSELDVSDDGLSEYTPVGETLFYKNNCLNTRFECVKTDKPYKSPFARLKPFLLSLARNVVGNTIIKNGLIDNVVRVHTDGIVIDKPFDFTKFEVLGLHPIIEDKTTGLITWYNVNSNDRIKAKIEINV